MVNNKKFSVGLIFPIRAKANIAPSKNLSSILSANFEHSIIIRLINSKVKTKDIAYYDNACDVFYSERNMLQNALTSIYLQIMICKIMLKNRTRIGVWILYQCETLVLPSILAKMLEKKVILLLAGFLENELVYRRAPFKILLKLKTINLKMGDFIILYSPSLVKNWKLERYRRKVIYLKEHIIDSDQFRILNNYLERELMIGYIGRLSEEKGVLNFVKAIPLMIKTEPNLTFLIGGSGHLRDAIYNYLKKNDLTNKVVLTDWIPHEKLPCYLNRLKLLILPSYTEGLPNVVLEAMACGTPCLCTSVGAISDIITDGMSGFILEDNDPRLIAERVTSILKREDLNTVSQNARAYVQENYSKEHVGNDWYKTIDAVL